MKAYDIFQNEVCIETLIRTIQKCEAGVAALIDDKEELLEK